MSEYTASETQETMNALAALLRGEMVVVKTDTGYGLSVDALNRDGLQRLMHSKSREAAKPVSVALASVPQIWSLAKISPAAEAIAKRHLPGPVTLVLPTLIDYGAPIVSDAQEIGIRVPQDETCLNLCRRLGRPITITSANVSGEDPPFCREDALRCAERLGVQHVLGHGTCKWTEASTVVRVSGSNVEVLRSGVIPDNEIIQAVGIR